MTEITRLNQSWDAIATSSVITPEQYSSVVESFGLYYQKFLGYQGDDELIWWKEAVGGQFFVETAKQSFWSHPLAKTSVVGASGLAATLLVSFALSENAERQPTFTYRESPPPASQADPTEDNASNSAASILQAVVPSTPSVEFSGSRPSSLNLDELPPVTVPRFARPSAEAPRSQEPAIAAPQAAPQLDKQNETSAAPTANPSTAGDRTPSAPAAQAQPTQTPTAQSPLTSPGRLTPPPATVANVPRSPAMDVLERLPSLEQADPTQVESTPGSPTTTHREAGSQPTANTPEPSSSSSLGEALPLPQAAPEAASAQPPAAEAPPTNQQPRLSSENLPSQPNSEAASNVPDAPVTKPGASASPQTDESNQSSGSNENANPFGFNRSVAFGRSGFSTSDVLATSPVFGSTIQNLSRLFVTGLQPAGEIPYFNAQAPAAPTTATPVDVAKVAESLNSIHDFLNFKQEQAGQNVGLMPLTQQAAIDVQHANQIERFRVLQLTPAQYEIAWSAINGMTGTLPPTPQHGFIDYQRQMIVVPAVS